MDAGRTKYRFALIMGCIVACATSAGAAERELDLDPPPSSTGEIETPIEIFVEEEPDRRPLFPKFRERIQDLPAFFADSRIEAHYRTYYLDKDRTTGDRSEAWAMGGSLHYRSGWFEDVFAVELEGFTSQPITAPDDRGGTLLLEPVQDGYGALGIANAKLRHRGFVLTGFRQYLDLPYVNRNDSRMTPNTFESITLAKPEGEWRFSTGYTWNIKPRNSDEFISMAEAAGVDKERGLAHAGALWQPSQDFHVGTIAGIVPDLRAGLYSEVGANRDLTSEVEGRIDAQFTYQWETGDNLLEESFEDTWIFGIRVSGSYANTVARLGFSATGPDATILNLYGSNPSYVDLMQRAFNRPDEKALLVSLSYDFSAWGAEGLSIVTNFVSSFEGKTGSDGRADSEEIDVTVDYRPEKGPLANFWLRARGSWLNDDAESRDGSDFRVIVRYDFPVI